MLIRNVVEKLALVRLLLVHCPAAEHFQPSAQLNSALKSITTHAHVAGSQAGDRHLREAFAEVEAAAGGVLALLRRDKATLEADRQAECRLASQGGCDSSSDSLKLCSKVSLTFPSSLPLTLVDRFRHMTRFASAAP